MMYGGAVFRKEALWCSGLQGGIGLYRLVCNVSLCDAVGSNDTYLCSY